MGPVLAVATMASSKVNRGIREVPGLLPAGPVDWDARRFAGKEPAGLFAAGQELDVVGEALGNRRRPETLRQAGGVEGQERGFASVLRGRETQERRGHGDAAGVGVFDVDRGQLVIAHGRRDDHLSFQMRFAAREHFKRPGQFGGRSVRAGDPHGVDAGWNRPGSESGGDPGKRIDFDAPGLVGRTGRVHELHGGR